MTAADLHAIVSPIKRRITSHQWFTLLSLCHQPTGMTAVDVYRSLRCGNETGIRQALAKFQSRGIVTVSLVQGKGSGRPRKLYSPTRKAFELLGLSAP